MDVSAITGTSTTSSSASTGLAENFDTFLKLLTTQLQYQDPLSPMDSNEFTAQLVQFAGVEQSIAANKNLEALVSLSVSSATGAAVSYLGREVTAGGEEAVLQDGSAVWGYTLDGATASTTILVKDLSGEVVYETEGEHTKGSHNFQWDGRTSDGGTAADGTYTIEVSAIDNAGNVIGSSTDITGTVTAVEIEAGTPYLTVGGLTLSLDQIRRIEPVASTEGGSTN